MTDGPTVALVCDATVATGLGHLSRCLALAEALAELGAAPTVVGAVDQGFASMLASVTGEVAHLPAPALDGTSDALAARRTALDALQPDLVVLDSYAVDADGVERLARGIRSAIVDDFCLLDRYPVDAIVNFTVAGPSLPYPATPTLLAGPAALLVRRALRTARASIAPATERVGRVLVALGGGDPHGATDAVVQALRSIDADLAIDVVLGRPGPSEQVLAAHADPLLSVTVGAPTLAFHLAAADLVVCGGGLTKYEAAYLGRPVAVLDQTAEQAGETQAFAARGLALPLGSAEAIDLEGLTAALARLLQDASARDALAVAGLAAFPVDPTLDVARALLPPG
jgi:spore coat polysaccharide biosynthesis predicted glycosyltransferase SpsG